MESVVTIPMPSRIHFLKDAPEVEGRYTLGHSDEDEIWYLKKMRRLAEED